MIQTGDWRRPRWLLIFTAFTAGLRRSVPVSPPLVSHPVRRFSLEILSAPRCDVATTTRTTFRFGFHVPQPGLRGTRACRHRTHRSRCRRMSGLFVCAIRRRQKTHLTGVSEDLSGKFLKIFCGACSLREASLHTAQTIAPTLHGNARSRRRRLVIACREYIACSCHVITHQYAFVRETSEQIRRSADRSMQNDLLAVSLREHSHSNGLRCEALGRRFLHVSLRLADAAQCPTKF